MTKKYIGFDIETVRMFGAGGDWRDYRPLGIGCAVAVASDWAKPRIWHGLDGERDDGVADRMSCEEAQGMVRDLEQFVEDGYRLVTWNGLGFDFDVLAEESGLGEACRGLTLGHVDMMFHMFCARNFRMALATACKAMRTGGKTEGMDGLEAVRMWHEGHRAAVMDYCAQDARVTLDLAVACEKAGGLRWVSRSGNPQVLELPGGWLTVAEANGLPLPDTSWMRDPLPRTSLSGWLGKVGDG